MIQLMLAVSKQNNFQVIESTKYRGLHLRLHEQVTCALDNKSMFMERFVEVHIGERSKFVKELR